MKVESILEGYGQMQRQIWPAIALKMLVHASLQQQDRGCPLERELDLLGLPARDLLTAPSNGGRQCLDAPRWGGAGPGHDKGVSSQWQQAQPK